MLILLEGLLVAACVAALLLTRKIKSLRGLFWPVVVSLPVVALLEVGNEKAGDLTVYSESFRVPFPPFRFPLAIVCGGALYAAALAGAAGALSRAVRARRLYWPIWLGLTLTGLLVEAAGVATGLWRWDPPRPWSPGFALGVWKYYVAFLLPAALVFWLRERAGRPSE